MKKYFLNKKVSEYGVQNGYVDYACLASSFQAVICNEIASLDLNLVHGNDYDEESGDFFEIFQYYIIDQEGYDILTKYTNELVYFCEKLQIYVWGITHWGTSWDYVLTNIKLD